MYKTNSKLRAIICDTYSLSTISECPCSSLSGGEVSRSDIVSLPASSRSKGSWKLNTYYLQIPHVLGITDEEHIFTLGDDFVYLNHEK